MQVSGLKSLLAAADEGMAAWEDDDMSDGPRMLFARQIVSKLRTALVCK